MDINKENDLLKIQTALKKIELIENFYVLELTKDHAKIRIKYFGKINKMKDKFYKKGVILKNGAEGPILSEFAFSTKDLWPD